MTDSQARLVIEGRANWAYTQFIGDKERITIGRAPENDVTLRDMHSSAEHCEIVKDGDGYLIRDLGSRNGIYVDGDKLPEARLRNGTQIRVGITSMSFLTGQDSSFATQASALLAGSMSKKRDQPEAALQPMLDRLDKVKLGIEESRSTGRSADLLAGAVEDLQRELRDAKATIRRMSSVNEFTRLVSMQSNPHEMVSTALNFMSNEVEAENGFVMQVDPATKRWVVRARFGEILDWSRASENEEKRLPMSLTLVEQTVRTGEPVVSQSALEDPRFDEAKSVLMLGIHSCLCFPMFSGRDPVGVTYVDRRSSAVAFGLGEEKLFGALTEQLNRVLYPSESEEA